MKLDSYIKGNERLIGLVFIGGGIVFAVTHLLRKASEETEAALREAANALINDNPILDVNQGTPYEGKGIVGTAANAVNRLSGGFLGKFGSFIGRKIADVRGI